MRVALISDLHGNLVAVEAVLADARRHGVDAVVCLGDVATCRARRPRPAPRASILGNHDEFLLEPALIARYTEAPIIHDAVAWCADQLTAADRARLVRYQREHTLTDGAATLHLFHGSPRSNVENLLATTPEAELDQMLAGRTAVVLAGGHTHVPLVRLHRGMYLVNPGSVGLAFREFAHGGPPVLLPHATYAIVDLAGADVAITSRAVELDRRRLRAAATAVAHPLAATLTAAYA